MDRSCTSEPNHSTAMRTVGSAALELLLSAAAGERRKPASASSAGPVVSEAPVLRQPQNGCRAGSKPQENPAPDAYPGYRSPLSKTESKPAGAWSPNLSVLVARRGNPPTQPRLEHRYYLPSDAWRLSLLGRGDGLVQSVRAQLGTLQHLGDQLLPNRARRRVPLRPTRNLEFRSGFAVHLLRVPGPAPKAWHLDQHGWPGPRPEHRCKSGMDGGLTAAILLSPPLHLRTNRFFVQTMGSTSGATRPASLVEELRDRSG